MDEYKAATEKEASSDTAVISRLGDVISIELKRNTEFNLGDTAEIVSLRNKFIDKRPFATLVVMHEGSFPTKRAREYIAALDAPLGKATAFVCDTFQEIAIADFYVKVNQPKTLTKVFRKKQDALKWLNEQI